MPIKDTHHNIRCQVDLEALARGITTNPAHITPRLKFTQEKREEFLGLLRKNANISVSARSVGVSPKTIDRWKVKEPAFKEAVEEALEEAVDYMESEVVRRGFQGVDKPVYYQGAVVGYETQYSDTLALRCLESHRPTKWSSKSSIDLKADVTTTSSDAKEKLLGLLNISIEDIEGECEQAED